MHANLNSPENREWAIGLFPQLANDPHFSITSPMDPRYNCIAWATNRNNVWWWPLESGLKLDGVFWPIPECDLHYTNLVKVFELQGFKICENYDFDPKFVKVALYVDEDDEFTHASRQGRDGLWKTKLGKSFDIVHGTPMSIEGSAYGYAKIIMAAKF